MARVAVILGAAEGAPEDLNDNRGSVYGPFYDEEAAHQWLDAMSWSDQYQWLITTMTDPRALDAEL